MKKLDKLRRLVNAAGGLHFNQPSEELTHVVMGQLEEDIKNFISKSTHRFELQRFFLCMSLITTFFQELLGMGCRAQHF